MDSAARPARLRATAPRLLGLRRVEALQCVTGGPQGSAHWEVTPGPCHPRYKGAGGDTRERVASTEGHMVRPRVPIHLAVLTGSGQEAQPPSAGPTLEEANTSLMQRLPSVHRSSGHQAAEPWIPSAGTSPTSQRMRTHLLHLLDGLGRRTFAEAVAGVVGEARPLAARTLSRVVAFGDECPPATLSRCEAVDAS